MSTNPFRDLDDSRPLRSRPVPPGSRGKITPVIIGLTFLATTTGCLVFFVVRALNADAAERAARQREIERNHSEALEPKQPKPPPPSVVVPAGKGKDDQQKLVEPLKRVRPAWTREAEAALVAAIDLQSQFEPEPRRPKLMTQGEYQLAVQFSKVWLAITPPNNAMALKRIDHLIGRPGTERTAAIMPRTVAVVEREAFLQCARKYSADDIERMASVDPAMRLLLDTDFKHTLLRRLPLGERTSQFDLFAAATDDKSEWSLLHPFDDLNENEMGDAVLAAHKAKLGGLGALTREQRLLLLRAGAIVFYGRLLAKAEGD
jgi:hypothetical protein